MGEYEILINASYMVNDHREWNCFKDYISANSKTEARALMTAKLKADGYNNIRMEIRY